MKISQSAPTNTLRVDTHLAKFSQGCTVLLTALAFFFDQPIIVLIAAIIMALSALTTTANPYRWLYQGIIVPLGLLKPRVVEDDPAPHRFAQGIGCIFLFAASLVLFFT